MSPAANPVKATYSTKEVAALLKLPEHRVRAYARAGLIGNRRVIAAEQPGFEAQKSVPQSLPETTQPVAEAAPQTDAIDTLKHERKGRGPLRFSFRDLSVLRMAERLSTQGMSHGRIERTLRALRHGVPQEESLAGLKVTSEDGRLLASNGKMRWDAESGQYEMLWQSAGASSGESAAPNPSSESDDSAQHSSNEPYPLATRLSAERAEVLAEAVAELGDEIATAQEWFEAGVSLEAGIGDSNEEDGGQPQRAYQAYLQTLACDPEHVEAMINIGRLCSAVGDGLKAAAYFRLAVRIDPDLAVAHFNLGVTLHDLGDEHGAIQAYAEAIHCDAEFTDAHYNLATLLEQLGDTAGARRHMELYLRHLRKDTE